MSIVNEMKLDFLSCAANEAFARMVISAFVLPVNPTREQLGDVKTSVSEAVTNAVVHGYGDRSGVVSLRARMSEDGELTVEITDRGRGIADIERARQPFFTTMEEAERSGMGFTVMESFMDDVQVFSTPGAGTTVRMKKQLLAPCESARRA